METLAGLQTLRGEGMAKSIGTLIALLFVARQSLIIPESRCPAYSWRIHALPIRARLVRLTLDGPLIGHVALNRVRVAPSCGGCRVNSWSGSVDVPAGVGYDHGGVKHANHT